MLKGVSMSIDRRSFLKTTAAGAAGISLAGGVIKGAAAADTSVWTDKMPINPDIDNMRVICMHDEKMAGEYGQETYKEMNAAVDVERVRSNLDGMARHLTQKTDTDAAWRTIFRSSKAWADTKVMIKVNNVANNNCARIAVLKKITDVLTGFGVVPANIVLFDGQGQYWDIYKDDVSLTDTKKIAGKVSKNYSDLGGKASVTVPNVTGGNAPADLVNGVTDIIVNIAVNKGHNSTFNVGKTTLCLKNHYGTFLDNSGMAMHLHNASNALTNINKTASIVGGDPVRQQLCIIDSLWAIKGNVTGSISHKPDRLIMGTFAGAVDYCCVKKVREEVMKVTNHEQENIKKFLTEFGYKETDPEWIEITPDMVNIEKVNHVRGEYISFRMSNPSYRQSTVRFSLPTAAASAVTVKIFSLAGGLIAQINHSERVPEVLWNGIASNGEVVRAGTYVVEIQAGEYKAAERFSVTR